MNNPRIDAYPTLESVQQRFKIWRSRKTRREPIPQVLWEAAAGLCRYYPISHVCRQLRLSFTELKKRVPISNAPPLQFVELDLASYNKQANRVDSWHMECERSDGTRLRVFGSGRPPSIEPLLNRFLP